MKDRKQCEKIYHAAFGTSKGFDERLFDYYFDNAETLTVDGQTVSMLFKIPCVIEIGEERKKAFYIYAVATDEQYRGKGYMSQLINKCCNDKDTLYFLKPVNQSLISFYEKVGFSCIDAVRRGNADAFVKTEENHKKLSAMCEHSTNNYTLMMRGTPIKEIKNINFNDTLE